MAIELNENQHADPQQCGSCHYFRPREYADGFGLCTFRFPPCWEMTPSRLKFDPDLEVGARTVRDTDGCDLYKIREHGAEPVQFMQKRYWNAGEPSR